MVVLVTGDRNWQCLGLMVRTLSGIVAKYPDRPIVVRHGGATGVDLSAHDAACALGLEIDRHDADWSDLSQPDARVKTGRNGHRYDAEAGPRRNRKMVDLGADLCLAFHPNITPSSGTWNCASHAVNAGIPTWHIRAEGVPPLRIAAMKNGRVEYEVKP